MDNLQKAQNSQLTTAQHQSGGLSTNLSAKAIELGKQVYHINQLAAFPLTSVQISDWAQSIEELAPEMTPEQLREIINQYKTGEMEYDKGQGIQNIFEGYRAIFGRRGMVY